MNRRPSWTARIVACCIGLTCFGAETLAQTDANAPAAGQSGGSPAPYAGFATGQSQQVAEPGLGPLFGPIFGPDHLFGNWGGARTWLQDHGVEVALDYLTENAGNITGGRQQAFRTAGQVGLEIDLDLAKIVGLKDNAFHTMIINGEGRDLANDALGDDIETPQEIYGGRGNVIARMVYAYDEQTFFHNRLDISAGWIPVGTYFASSPINCDFMNVVTCGNPHPLPTNASEADWPDASFGGQFRLLALPQIYVMAGVFAVDNDYGDGGGGISGWAWADPHKSGVTFPMEAGWVPKFGPDHLVGHYKIGFDTDTHHWQNVAGLNAPSHNRQSEYVLVDQMLQRQGKGDTAGLIVFGGIVHEKASVSPLEMQAFGGAVSTGAAWGRPGDTVGVNFHWLKMSAAFTTAEEVALAGGTAPTVNIDGFGAAYGPQNTEDVIELDYTATVFRGVQIMPDFEYIIRPGATTNTPDAAILGFRTNINF